MSSSNTVYIRERERERSLGQSTELALVLKSACIDVLVHLVQFHGGLSTYNTGPEGLNSLFAAFSAL